MPSLFFDYFSFDFVVFFEEQKEKRRLLLTNNSVSSIIKTGEWQLICHGVNGVKGQDVIAFHVRFDIGNYCICGGAFT